MRVAQRWTVEQRRRWLSPRTVADRFNQLERFAAFIYPTPLVDATTEQVEGWVDGCNLGARSRYSYLSNLRSFYDFTERFGLTAGNPARQTPMPRLKRLVPRPLADDDLRFALRAADPRMKAWLTLAAYNGLRCKEIAGLRREDLLLDRDPPMVMITSPKGGNEAVMPLNPIALSALRVHGLPGSGFVFTLNDGRPITPGTLSCYVGKWLKEIGIERGAAHRLRHWFGSTVYEQTRDIRVTQELLRHADVSTTIIYAAFSKPEATAAVMALDVGDYATN